MTHPSDPRITLAIDHLYAIGESDQAEAIESLRAEVTDLRQQLASVLELADELDAVYPNVSQSIRRAAGCDR